MSSWEKDAEKQEACIVNSKKKFMYTNYFSLEKLLHNIVSHDI